jgi:hypothetical protein
MTDKKTVYRYEEKVEEAPAPPQEFGHEELIRKEYVNPPSDFAPGVHHRLALRLLLAVTCLLHAASAAIAREAVVRQKLFSRNARL